MKVYAAQETESTTEEAEEDDDDAEEDEDVIIEEEDSEDEAGGEEIQAQDQKDKQQDINPQQTEQQDAQKQQEELKQQEEQKQQEAEKTESKSAEKVKIKHRKLTVEASSKKPNYYDKMAIGEELKLTVKIKSKRVKNKFLKFSSSKSSVASVTENGVITAKKNGTARIKIVNKKKKSQKCFINVTVAKNTVRTLYIGDSRSVDLFSATAEAIFGEVHNDVVVCALNGGKVTFLNEVINHSDLSDYDTIVTWMGCNDFGAFKPYTKIYNRLVSKGKKLVLCSVGPTDYGCLDEGGQALMNDGIISGFNFQLKSWANKKNVKTVPMYEYVSKHVAIDHRDGVHYSPKPNKSMWNYILDCAE